MKYSNDYDEQVDSSPKGGTGETIKRIYVYTYIELTRYAKYTWGVGR